MDGIHTIERSEEITARVLESLFSELFIEHVRLEGLLLKVIMIVPGYACPERRTAQEVAEWTVLCLTRHVPAAVPGIVFLSGGQSEETATLNLDAISRTRDHPWELSFSFGRALQDSALRMWASDARDIHPAQAAFLERARSTRVR